jgi:hypothetical protein
MYCNNSGGVCFFFDIDVKGGESVVISISWMLQWYSWTFFKGLPSMPKGEIVGMFSDRGKVCVFVIDGKDHDQQHNNDRMERSEAKLFQGCYSGIVGRSSRGCIQCQRGRLLACF